MCSFGTLDVSEELLFRGLEGGSKCRQFGTCEGGSEILPGS